MENDIKGLIERLEYFNSWRRGANTIMPNVSEIGADIDLAIKLLKEFSEEVL